MYTPIPSNPGQTDLNALMTELLEERLKHDVSRQELLDQAEELEAQKEELTAAIEELAANNKSLVDALEQLRDRNFELDQILYRTSHDMRGPLSSIKGILALLQTEPQSDTIRHYARHIGNKTEQMDNLLRSLSSLSKSILEEPRLDRIDLHQLIHRVIGEYQQWPAWSQVDVRVQVDRDEMYSDLALMTIIFQSLISNAYTFRDPVKKGQLTIRSKRDNERWIIDVLDDGEGIDPSIQEHIFNMFYRGSERSTGNGLGLYVARKAAGRLKGNISYGRDADRTRFTVTLPCK
jgi:signal transduction histidine kinase